MAITLDGTNGVTAPNLTSTTSSTLASMTQALNLGSTGQVVFPATQNASSDANTLDDYEEGTFTPIAVGTTSAGTGTYGVQSGTYTKLGRVVEFEIILTWSAHTGTGNLAIGGLPFNFTGNRYATNIVGENLTYSGQLVALNNTSSATQIAFFSQTSNAGLSSVVMDTSVSYLVVTGIYTTST